MPLLTVALQNFIEVFGVMNCQVIKMFDDSFIHFEAVCTSVTDDGGTE